MGARAAAPSLANGGRSAKGNSSYGCAGCHTVSRDGSKVALTLYGGDGAGGIASGVDRGFLMEPATHKGDLVQWNFATFSPDGSLLLTNWAGQLTLRDGTTGDKKRDIDPALTGGRAILPAWSPDGRSVAFVQLPAEGKLGRDFPNSILTAGDWDAGNAGSIAILPYAPNQPGGAPWFQKAEVLVPAIPQSEYHYYPSWSPDSQWILYVTGGAHGSWPGASKYAAGEIWGMPNAPYPPDALLTYAQETNRLRIVSVSDGKRVFELTQAGRYAFHPAAITAWPRLAPFAQQNGQLLFFSFDARFPYGHTTDGVTPQLWMAAIDLSRARLPGDDPSLPPLWLPMQDPTHANLQAEWAEHLHCDSSDDCLDAKYVCCPDHACRVADVEGGCTP